MTENRRNLPRLAEGATLPEAAVAWAAAGWRVHPCSPDTKRPFLAADIDPETKKKIPSTGGVSKASADEALVAGWWKKWRKALVGVAMGDDRLFVVDFDPRVDDDTGEVWTLDRLKADTEDMMGCALPVSVTSMTQSGGVHLWLRWPDDGGDPIRNSGSLPKHVDVRGEGGYVIVPPSVMKTGARYRWLKGKAPGEVEVAEAPAELVALLRAGKEHQPKSTEKKREKPRPERIEHRPSASGAQFEAQRKYALSALDAICRDIRQPGGAGNFGRNDTLNAGAYAAAALVAAGVLDEGLARAAIEAAAKANPGRDDAVQLEATLNSGWDKGYANPKDLRDIGARAGGPPRRADWVRDDLSTAVAAADAAGHSPSPVTAPHPALSAGFSPTLPDGRDVKPPSSGEGVALQRRGAAWVASRLAAREPYDDSVQQREAREKLAYSIGRRVAGALIPPIVAMIAVAVLAADVGGEEFDDETRVDQLGGESLAARKIWEAALAGTARPAEPGKWLTDIRCAPLPMTDMGNAERFVARFGDDYRFTTAKGWMGWDGKRWHILDQENDVTPAVVMAAVFATVRAIQDEAAALFASGLAPREALPSKVGLARTLDHAGVDELLVRTPGGSLMWISEEPDDDDIHKTVLVTRPADPIDAEARLDKVLQIKSNGDVVLLSDKVAAHGRASEGSARLSCIANLAKRWLTVSIEDFDTDPFAINCANGTVRLSRERDAAGIMRANAVLVPHNRGDLISKLAPVDYDPDAPAPIYDALMEWAQPDPAMRRYLHQWGGYSTSGHVGEQKLQFWYGRGANGKSTVIDAWAGTVGDYAGTIQIDTFLDQGLKKRGDAATPDLARLGGVRMLRASEPERGAKLNEALVKAATGGEPMAVRALHKGFFDLRPQFKLTIGGNYKPDVPGTDEGIWRRIKLVPWDSFLTEAERDEDMPHKLKAEYSGILARLVAGLLDWMENGFVEPKAVTDATADYRDDSDPLARFLRMCVEVTGHEGDRVQSSVLHNVFCAWAKAAGEYDWKNKRFTLEMKAKGFKNKQSNGMQFLGLKLLKDVADFIDADGRVIQLHDDVTGDGGGDFGSLDAAAASRGDRDRRDDDDDYDDGFGDRQPWQDRD